MTIEEAIYELETNVCYATNNIRRACIMAVEALEQQKTGKWIPIKTRPLTREEFEQYGGESGCEVEFAYDCPIPEDGEEVLITTDFGSVEVDTFCRDSNDGCYFESYYGAGDVLAWQPLPKPYKEDCEGE